MPNENELPDDLMDMVSTLENAPLRDPSEHVEAMSPEQAQTEFFKGQIAAAEATEDIAATLCPDNDDEDPETLHALLKSMRDEQRLTRMALERIADAAEKALGV